MMETPIDEMGNPTVPTLFFCLSQKHTSCVNITIHVLA